MLAAHFFFIILTYSQSTNEEESQIAHTCLEFIRMQKLFMNKQERDQLDLIYVFLAAVSAQIQTQANPRHLLERARIAIRLGTEWTLEETGKCFHVYVCETGFVSMCWTCNLCRMSHSLHPATVQLQRTDLSSLLFLLQNTQSDNQKKKIYS